MERNDESRLSLVGPVIGVMLTVILAVYAIGYFQMGTVSAIGPNRVRTYSSRFEAEMFAPCAVVETQLTGRTVYVGHSP